MIDAARKSHDDRAGRPYWKLFEKALLIVVIVDAALGGNGYLIQIEDIRLRVLLFPICMVWTGLRLTRFEAVRLPAAVIWLVAFFVGLTAFDAALGYYHGSETAAIIAELKPLSYFPMLLFFAATIQRRDDVTLVAGLLAGCGMLLALVYLATIACIRLDLIDDQAVWQFLQGSDEFIFRGFPITGFLYKGDFYIAIAALFLIFDPFKGAKLLALVAVIGTVMTFTRGLVIALLVCIAVGLVVCRDWRRMVLLAGQSTLLLAVLILVWGADQTTSPAPANTEIAQPCPPPSEWGEPAAAKISAVAELLKLPEHISLLRSEDDVRTADIKWVVDQLDWSTALIGRGFGAPMREAGRKRIEVNYLEIIYKQGVLGLAIWGFVFLYTIRLCANVPPQTRRFGLAFSLTVLYVFVANATNPFLPGSIGMAPVFISMTSLLVLANESPDAMQEADWYGYGAWRLLRPLQRLNLGLLNAAVAIALVGILLFLTNRLSDNRTSSAPLVSDQGSAPFPVLIRRLPIRSATRPERSPLQQPTYRLAQLPQLPPDQALYFCSGRNASALLTGWSASEPEGTWSEGHSAYVGFVVNGSADSGPPRQAIIHVSVWLVRGKLKTQRVQIWSGDRELGEYQLHGTPADLEVPLAGLNIENGSPLILGFYLPDANSPHTVVNSTDYRTVAIRIEGLELVW